MNQVAYVPIKLERLTPNFDDHGAQTSLPHPSNSIRLDSDRLLLGLLVEDHVRCRRRYPFHHLITDLPGALIRLALFLPLLLLFTPRYILSRLSARWLASNEEEEAQAQFKAVGGLLWQPLH